MAVLNLALWEHAKEVVAPTSAATAAPTAASDQIVVDGSRTVRLYVAYTTGVTAATLRIHNWDGLGWHRAQTITLDPAGGNQSVDITVGLRAPFFVRVESMTITAGSGGTLRVRAETI